MDKRIEVYEIKNVDGVVRCIGRLEMDPTLFGGSPWIPGGDFNLYVNIVGLIDVLDEVDNAPYLLSLIKAFNQKEKIWKYLKKL